MATVVITIVTPDSVADVEGNHLQFVTGASPYTLTNPQAKDRVARYIDGIAQAALNETSFTVAVS